MDESKDWITEGNARSKKAEETLRSLRNLSDQKLDEHRQRFSSIESTLNAQLQQIAEELARDHSHNELETTAFDQKREELERSKQLLTESKQQIASLHEQLTAQSDERDAELVGYAQRLEQLQQRQNQKKQEQQRLSGEIGQLQEVLLTANKETETLRRQLAALSGEQESSKAAADKQLHQLQEQCQLKEHERDRLVEKMEKAQAALTTSEAEIKQTNQKFELALADVEKLKRENAELSEELARRPEEDDRESPELISLRSERDTLANRVTELESAPPTLDNSNAEQEVADLQRRFEMAVEDVRELKQENAELRTQVGSTPTPTPTNQSTDGLDWQAQKTRLLAELEAEERGGSIAPDRMEERATIEGTISITDRVVAKKDQEIADLKAQLETIEQVAPTQEEIQQAAHEELFDSDEIIQTERTRLTEAKHEWETKLRKAELELSVQRATLARQQAALDEKLAQLKEQSVGEETGEGETPTDGKPRRRWLSALGLKDEDK